MKPETKEFRLKASKTLGDAAILKSLDHVYSGFHEGRIKAAADTDNWEHLRSKGKAIKDHTIAHLDHYLEMLAENVKKPGWLKSTRVVFGLAFDSLLTLTWAVKTLGKVTSPRHENWF